MYLWIFAAALLLGAVLLFNRLVRLRNEFGNAFSQIDVQLTRRYELIPNLVETAKGYLRHERETLESVVLARDAAADGLRAAAATPGDPSAIRTLEGAESALRGSLGRLFALVEAYPDLKANHNMMQLSEELSSTENRIAFARQAYNDSVMRYNIARETFPGNLVAGLFAFKGAQPLQIGSEAARDPVKVSFG